MIEVKEFLSFKSNDKEINKWLNENPNIKIIDIKYSISFAQECRLYDSEAISGVLIIYDNLQEEKNKLEDNCRMTVERFKESFRAR